jgi:hypothetical protein
MEEQPSAPVDDVDLSESRAEPELLGSGQPPDGDDSLLPAEPPPGAEEQEPGEAAAPPAQGERCPYVEQLHVGLTGSHVAAYQRMLHRWNATVRPGWATPSEAGAFFGDEMRGQVKAFQRAWSDAHPAGPGIPQTGFIGPVTHRALLEWADSRACFLLAREYDRRHPSLDGRELAVAAARMALEQRGRMIYSGPGTTHIPKRWQGIAAQLVPPACPTYADCSSLASWCLWVAREHGAADPSENGWSWGTTYSMVGHGRPLTVSTALPGSLFFYNSPSPTHVAIMVERAKGLPFVCSFGSQGGPSYVRYDYRSDVSAVRDYLAG